MLLTIVEWVSFFVVDLAKATIVGETLLLKKNPALTTKECIPAKLMLLVKWTDIPQ